MNDPLISIFLLNYSLHFQISIIYVSNKMLAQKTFSLAHLRDHQAPKLHDIDTMFLNMMIVDYLSS